MDFFVPLGQLDEKAVFPIGATLVGAHEVGSTRLELTPKLQAAILNGNLSLWKGDTPLMKCQAPNCNRRIPKERLLVVGPRCKSCCADCADAYRADCRRRRKTKPHKAVAA